MIYSLSKLVLVNAMTDMTNAFRHLRKSWIVLGVALAFATLAVDTYPVVLNDSIAYLTHSQSLAEYGIVSFGYRQIGYPLWLALWDWIGSAVEPFALVSLVQRGAFLVVAVLAVRKLGKPGLILVGLLLVPTYIAYSNLILTEAVGIPLATLAGVLLAVLLMKSGLSESVDCSTGIRLLIASSATVAVALAMVRFHYVVIGGALLAAILWMGWRNPRVRRAASIWAFAATATIGLAFLFMSLENRSEFGEFFPTVRGERVQFWTLWQVVVEPNPGTIQDRLPAIFADGNPYTFMAQVDSLDYEEAKEVYSEARQAILEAAGTSMWRERASAAGAALIAGRIDDLRSSMSTTAQDVLPGELELRIHRNNFARGQGVMAFNDTFNEGRITRAGFISSGPIPQLPMPQASDVFAWLVPISTILLLAGLTRRDARPKAIAGLAVLMAYVSLAGWFILDNFRFLLPAYMVTLVLAASVTRELVDAVKSPRVPTDQVPAVGRNEPRRT